MVQHRRYRNPPIEEALCEFRFRPGREWDLTVPGKLQAALGDAYSGRSREQKAVKVGLGVRDGQPSDFQYREGLARVQLATADGQRLVGVGKDVLSIHMLRPYQRRGATTGGWDEFKPRIAKALSAYWRVAEPEGVIRVGVRYINKLMTRHGEDRPEEYFACSIPRNDVLPEKVRAFACRIEYPYADGVRLILIQGLPASSTADSPGFLLDLDVIREDDTPLNQQQALEVAADLRGRERQVFESVITEKARRLFDAE